MVVKCGGNLVKQRRLYINREVFPSELPRPKYVPSDDPCLLGKPIKILRGQTATVIHLLRYPLRVIGMDGNVPCSPKNTGTRGNKRFLNYINFVTVEIV
jgi:hypothetical protein